MSVPGTITRTFASSMTAARVRNVMIEVGSDFTTMAVAGIITMATRDGWHADLTHLLELEVVKSFQVQFTSPGRGPFALEYEVSADGSLRSSDASGDIDYFALPADTKAFLFVSINWNAPRSAAAKEYMVAQNWSFDGSAVGGQRATDKVYSSEGYGVTRAKVGGW